MGCTPTGNKTFLVVCNIGLLFFGLTILSLGVKMRVVLETFLLDGIPLLKNSVKAVVATGFFISVTGGAGFCAGCYEIMWLVIAHLAGLTLIVVMEFSLGVTLMVIKNTIEAALEETECGDTCRNMVTFVVMKLATASAGTMLTIIIIEALMIYSAIQFYFYLRDLGKNPPPVAAGPTVVVQNVQMQSMAAPAPPPQPQFVMAAPQPQYPPQQYAPQPQQYAPQPMPQQYVPQQYAPQPAPQQYAPQPAPQQYAPQTNMAPPAYSQLQPSEPQTNLQPSEPQTQLPPTVQENFPETVPPLDTSTLTRKTKAQGDV